MKMISAVLLSSLLIAFTSANAGVDSSGGGTPFGYSGEALQAIFNSPLVWRKVFGSVKQVVLVSQSNISVTYQMTTTEGLEVKSTDGGATAWRQVSCETLATVTNVSKDEMIPKLEVTNVDFSKCPSVLNQ